MTHCRSCIWNLRVCVQKCVCVCVSVAIGLSPLELDFPTLKHLALGVTASRHPSSHSDFPLNVLLLAACSRVSTIPSNHTQSSGHHPFPLAALTCFLLAYLLVAPNLIPGVFALHSWCLLCCSYCFFSLSLYLDSRPCPLESSSVDTVPPAFLSHSDLPQASIIRGGGWGDWPYFGPFLAPFLCSSILEVFAFYVYSAPEVYSLASSVDAFSQPEMTE